jgi:hypothetical protein
VVSIHASDRARVIPLRPATAVPAPEARAPRAKEPLWRHVVGGVLRGERRAQERTLKDVAETARISMPYLSEIERGRKEASSEVLAAAAQALGLELTDVLALVQSELARVRGVRSGRAARPGLSGPVGSAGPAGSVGSAERVRPGRAAAAESDDATGTGTGTGAGTETGTETEAETAGETATVTSVSALTTPRSGTRPAAPHHGDVRLAA